MFINFQKRLVNLTLNSEEKKKLTLFIKYPRKMPF